MFLQVIDWAQRQAGNSLTYGEERIAAEHLLLGILREGEGIAVQVLLALGIDLGTVRAEVSRSFGSDGA